MKPQNLSLALHFPMCHLQTFHRAVTTSSRRITVRVEDMKLLLLLIMIYGVDGGNRASIKQKPVNPSAKESTAMPNTAFDAWCKKKKDDFLKADWSYAAYEDRCKKEMDDFLKADCFYTALNAWCKKEMDDFLKADCFYTAFTARCIKEMDDFLKTDCFYTAFTARCIKEMDDFLKTDWSYAAYSSRCKKEIDDFLKDDCFYTALNAWCKKEIDDFLKADCFLLKKEPATWIFKILCLSRRNKEDLENITKKEKECIQSILTTTDESKTYYFSDFAMTVVLINFSKTDNRVPINAPSVSNNTQTIQTLIPVEPFQNVPEDQQKVGIVTYNSHTQFNLNNSIMSQVIRIEVPGHYMVKLNSTNPLIIYFPVNNYTNNANASYIYSCQYYDEQGDNTWKTDGCNTTQLSDNLVECSCNHMTPFAVLLVEVNNIDERQWEILSYISYVGCGLSAFFSACSVLPFIFNRNSRAEVSSSIHVSLSGALFLLNISFMLSEWGATLTEKGACVFIAVMIHYSLLSCFTWMSIEALHLYLLLIRVFNIYIKHYIIKLSLIGWGVPAVVIGSLLSIHIRRPIYGTRDVTFSNSNATNAVCWITEPFILYGVNLSYFTAVFMFNLLVLIRVSRQIYKLKKVEKKKHKIIPVKDAGTVLGLMCLLGTSWGLVFLSSGYTNYPILYLFCVSNTMQGVSIFLWMFQTARPDKQKSTHTKSLSTVDTFPIEKQNE